MFDHLLQFLPTTFSYLSWSFVIYFLSANLIFVFLLFLSFIVIRRIIWSGPMIKSVWERTAELGSPISIIAPARNESEAIVESTLSFLSLNYPKHEVIVVNDGSTDNTLLRLIENFGLEKADAFYDGRLSKSKIHGIYRSKFYQHLLVIDKENGGKADAINVGLGFSKFELVCAVDSDSVLDDDALIKVAIPFIEDPELVIASGGTVRPLNGSRVEYGRVVETGVSFNPLVLIQTVEYLRAFLFGRIGWNEIDGTLIISGAFGIFRKDAVMEAGGFSESTVSEDMELVLRLRKWAVDHDQPRRISFVPDPICWTQVPSDLMSLGRQRRRWQRGLAESLWAHRQMFFNRRYGAAGILAYPYFLCIEFFGPIIEVCAYTTVICGWLLGWVQLEMVYLLLVVDFLFSVLMSVGAILIEESAYHKYPKIRFLFLFLFAAVLEPLGYRQYTTFWRILGILDFVRGTKKDWGEIQRQALS